MNNKLRERILKTVYDTLDDPTGRFKHFSFIVDGNKILSVGHNNSFKTHTLAAKYNHRFSAIHSEISALIRFQYEEDYLRKCKLVNVRVDRNGKICMARPCQRCLAVLDFVQFREVWFTNTFSLFERL